MWRRRVMDFLRLFDGKVEELAPEVDLFTFREINRTKPTWKASLTTDAAWGGQSTADFSIKSGRGLFSGVISKEPLKDAIPPEKLGFAAVTFQLPDDSYMKCDDYRNLVVRGRPDDNLFSITLRGVAILAPELAYQGYVRAAAPHIVDMVLPFESFVQTRGGKISERQLILDGGVRFNAISIALTSQKGGPFAFEIDRIFINNQTF